METLIFLIILGLIFSMFGKKKNNSTNNSRPIRRQNPAESPIRIPKRETTADWDVPSSDWERRLQELDKRFSKPWLEKETEVFNEQRRVVDNRAILEDKKIEMDNPVHFEGTSERKKQETNKKIVVQKTIKNVEKTVKVPAVVQGMIWDEVFSPPRSKNPHRVFQK